MELSSFSSHVYYDVLRCPLTSNNSVDKEPNNILSIVREHIYSPNFIKNVTLFFPATDTESGRKFREESLELEDRSCIVSNITLLSLTNIVFVLKYLVPKNIFVFNIHDGPSSRINFLINSKGILYLMLDLEVFRSLGLANCKIIHRNKDESVTLEVNLTDPLYTNDGSKMYERLQNSLSKLSPASVLVSSENTNALDLDELKNLLEKISKDFVLLPCFVNTIYMRVPLNTKYISSKDINEKLNLLNGVLNNKNKNEINAKRRKKEMDTPNLESRFKKLMENRDILLKVFNTIKKNSGKTGKVFKNMIHELNQKNVHNNFDIYNEKTNDLVPNILKLVDLLNLNSIREPEEYKDHRGFEFYDLIKINNGLVSKELAFNLFRNSWEVLLEEAEFFILSLYTLNEKRMITSSMVEDLYNTGNYSHIFCTKSNKTNEVIVVIIKSN